MDRNPARTATLTDSADWAWQFSHTPDSRACSPAALASSWVYWVICEPPGMNTSSLESRNLTASKPIAACSRTNARHASGPCHSGSTWPSGVTSPGTGGVPVPSNTRPLVRTVRATGFSTGLASTVSSAENHFPGRLFP